MTKFKQVIGQNLEKLELYVPVVARVHGGTHPEFHEVHRLFKVITEKIEASGVDRANLDGEFAKLREITSNYAVPSDVCESYEAVYTILAELDEAYTV